MARFSSELSGTYSLSFHCKKDCAALRARSCGSDSVEKPSALSKLIRLSEWLKLLLLLLLVLVLLLLLVLVLVVLEEEEDVVELDVLLLVESLSLPLSSSLSSLLVVMYDVLFSS